tara:strand:+ start:42 stop:845 length:804 start_codon:yes stop_codon:yes gene_type:complete
MSLFGSLQASFAAGGARGAAKLGGMFLGGQMAKPDYNSLYAKAINETKSGLNLRDLQALEKALRELEPRLLNKFKRDAKKLGEPAKKDVVKAFRAIPRNGPLGPIRRKGRTYDKMSTNLGRLAWSGSSKQRNAIDVNYKSRSQSAFKKGMSAQDKTLSVIRVRVRGAAYVVADIAGASMKSRKASGEMSRKYQINAFGKGVVTRDHRISASNVDNWIMRLNGSSGTLSNKPSRYAWPAFRNHAKEYRVNFGSLVNEVVSETNRRLQS